MRSGHAVVCVAVLLIPTWRRPAAAQSFGVELHNSLMPASAGMAGASIALPQDLQSALNGNPATLTQFSGTQFAFGSAWADPTYRIEQPIPLPLLSITPYEADSNLPGSALGNIGVTQELSSFGMPVTVGIGFISSAGAGVDFRHIPQSNGTSAEYVGLDVVSSAAVNVTDRLSAGGSLTLGMSFLDGPFVGNSAMALDYALRGSLGAAYQLTQNMTAGVYWQSKKNFQFKDAISIAGGPFQDIQFDHPENLGFGVATNGLMNGRLLLAADVLYKRYSQADFFRAIYDDQWVFQVGSQFTVNPRLRVRLGYADAENAMRDLPGTEVGGVVPPSVEYVQAQFAAINKHRLSGGVGVRDILLGVDLDIFAGGMFDASQTFGTTTASVSSYWIGAGLTWRFQRGTCSESCAPVESCTTCQ